MAECPNTDHSTCSPDECFAAKLAYWRERGMAVSFTGGRELFHESCIPERQRKIVERAAANGWEARPMNPLYDRPANFKGT